MEIQSEINNRFYEYLGERWYTAQDDPVALLRAENKLILPWVTSKIKEHHPHASTILDVGCGGGLLSNELAKQGFLVTGIDISPDSLCIAEAFDETQSVKYQVADAFKLPFEDESFDVITSMDFLEHVESPAQVIKEISRVLRPRGLFFFHTFNRNFISWFVVIKLVEWLVKNTPKNMHILRLFITPEEMKRYCTFAGLEIKELTGLRPVFSSINLKLAFSGIVSPDMRFSLTKSQMISYLGVAEKIH